MPPTSGNTERDIGMLIAQVAALKEQLVALSQQISDRLDHVEQSIEEGGKKLDDVTTTISQARGGWRVLVMLGTGFMAVGAFADRVFVWMWR